MKVKHCKYCGLEAPSENCLFDKFTGFYFCNERCLDNWALSDFEMVLSGYFLAYCEGGVK